MLDLSFKGILKMAVPIMLGSFIQNFVAITDSIMVNQLGTEAFGAANNAGLLYIVFFMLLNGLGEGTQIQIAKEYGEAHPSEITKTLINSFSIQFIFSTLLIAILFILKPIFLNQIVLNPIIQSQMSHFLDFRLWGLFFAGLQVSAIAFYMGIGKTKIIIYYTLILAFSNIFLDYTLIFGHFGFPKMGIEGAALASTASEAISFLFLFIYLIKTPLFAEFNFLQSIKQGFVFVKTKLLLKLSAPLMLKGFLSLSTWFVFFSMIEQMGKNELEASHVVRNLFFLTFIPIFGFGSTARTYISYFNARLQKDLIKTSLFKISFLSVIFYFLVFHGAILYPSWMIQLISKNPLILEDAIQILKIVFGSMLLYSIIIVPFNAVSAVGKTVLTFWIEFVAIVFYLGSTYLVIHLWNWPVSKIWYVEYIYFCTMGLLSVTVFLKYLKGLKQNEQ